MPGLPEVTTVNNKGSFCNVFFLVSSSISLFNLIYGFLSILSCKVALIKRRQVDVNQI